MRSILVVLIALAAAPAFAQSPAPAKPAEKPKRPDTEIVKLEKALVAAPTDRAKMEAVWVALLHQENWFFIWRPDEGAGHPRVGQLDGKPYVQCFSDRAQALDEALLAGLDDSAVRAIPVAKAARMLAALDGGEIHQSTWDSGQVPHAMTMPLRNYPDIYSYLLKKKLP